MRVSFIIPTYNTLGLTRQCLDSLARTVNLRAHETIIIDDGSTDGTVEYLATLPPIFKVVINSANQGYGRTCNEAARIAQGELLCFCNSDLIFLRGWLRPLIQAERKLKHAGFIGNIQRTTSDGLIDHLGVKFLPDGRPLHIGIKRLYAPWRRYMPVSAVTAACCVIRKDLFLEFNGFSEAFRNGFEDTDLCLRLLEKGYEHYVANRSTVLHHISSSPGRKVFEDENLKLFLDLWKETTVKISRREEEKWKKFEDILAWNPFFRFFLYFHPSIRDF